MAAAYRIELLAEEMGKLNATDCSSEEAIANYVLNHLRGYRQSATGRATDVSFVIAAIQAYAKLIQDAGVRIV